MREELIKATALVQDGMTYGEAAAELGLTRNQVAGACSRAGIKATMSEAKRSRINERNSQSQLVRWATMPPERRRVLTAHFLTEAARERARAHMARMWQTLSPEARESLRAKVRANLKAHKDRAPA